MVNDPAWGRSKAERAGVSPKKRSSKKAPQVNKAKQIRNENVGIYGGPRGQFQRYTVSEQAADILNRSLRNQDSR